MDRNLNILLSRLAAELAEAQRTLEDEYGDAEEEYDDARQNITLRIDAIQDEIWDIEDALRDEAEFEAQNVRGWN